MAIPVTLRMTLVVYRVADAIVMWCSLNRPVYRPVKMGSLFSMKARKPSVQSSEFWVRANWSMSAWLAVALRALGGGGGRHAK